MKLKKGFSIVEMISAAVLLSTVALISAYQYQRVSKHSLKNEAKIQLGHLYQGQKSYFFDNKTFTSILKNRVAFPKGNLIYNVGFHNDSEDYSNCNPQSSSGGHSPVTDTKKQLHNYWQLCGNNYTQYRLDTDTADNDYGHYSRTECALRNKKNESLTEANVQLTTTDLKDIGIKPSFGFSNGCNLSNPGKHGAAVYTEFKAYAVGDILEPDGSSPKCKKDIWSINHNGKLENCQNPLEDTKNCCASPPCCNP